MSNEEIVTKVLNQIRQGQTLVIDVDPSPILYTKQSLEEFAKSGIETPFQICGENVKVYTGHGIWEIVPQTSIYWQPPNKIGGVNG